MRRSESKKWCKINIINMEWFKMQELFSLDF